MTTTSDARDADAPAGTGSRATAWLGGAVLVGLALLAYLGLVAAPEDDLMEDAVRIIFVHVPIAILTYVCFGVTAVGSVMLSLIHISEPTRLWSGSRMPSSA